jgi:hypothetical protein
MAVALAQQLKSKIVQRQKLNRGEPNILSAPGFYDLAQSCH